MSIAQMLEHHLEKSPRHKAYIYDDGQGEIVSIEFAQYIRTVYAACRNVLRDIAPHKAGAVVAIFADAGTGMLIAAIMRANMVPFCLSPRNAETNPVGVYISPDLTGVMAQALALRGTPLPVFEAPNFQRLQGELDFESSAEPLPALQMQSTDSTAYILHSSGEKAFIRPHSDGQRPPDLSHKMLLQYASPPWTATEDYCGQILGAQNLPNYHGIGVFLGTWPFSSGLVMAVLRPTTPPMRGTPENALNGIIATKADIVLSTPAPIEVWSESSRGLNMMKSLKALSYLGAQLNKRVGDALVANGVVLCSTYGAMEVGLVAPFFWHHGADWDYITMREGVEVVKVPEEDGSLLYTHTYIVSPSFATCFTNSTVDGRPGCSVSDLLERHPEKPELHRVYGRKDDLIVLSSGFKAHINRNPFVDAALVFGQGRIHPGVIIQLKPEFQANSLDYSQRSKVYESLWVSVDEVNRKSPAHFQIPRKMILLANPVRPFALTSKLQPRRRVVFENYQEEISAAYL
ncbi:hypothetical protein B0H13DRAFT_2047560 [Mycena leptocephala]|nr:hypothetical protein B0H13DRAFT_2047560 [Mycena leptocephala]